MPLYLFSVQNWALIENGTISIARIQEIVELPGEETTEITNISKKKGVWPVQGSVVFDDVKLRYKEDLPLTLKGVSFVIKPGTKVGICGRTGCVNHFPDISPLTIVFSSGKSSTVQALFRTVEKSLVSGKILIDGVDIQTLPLKMVRESLRYALLYGSAQF